MPPIDPDTSLPLLGGLSPRRFMARHWQKQPLLVRQAMPAAEAAWLTRADLFALAAREGVESRLVAQREGRWTMRHGPLARRALPPLDRPQWTLLVQGLDLHLQAAHALMQRFRFVPDARLDDLMVSYASAGGGVGPHVDSYDVFLLQLQGRRRWRIAPLRDEALQPGLPLRILANFEAEQEWVLEPGDMLYLPPGVAHDGTGEGGDCMTASIGFRAPGRDEIARGLLQRALEVAEDEAADDVPTAMRPRLYRDPRQTATETPARVPEALRGFALDALQRWLAREADFDAALGELLSEPKPGVWFDGGAALAPGRGAVLDRRTRMLYDERHVFINGEAFRAGGRDARLMRRLADDRRLPAPALATASADAQALLQDWAEAGWLHADDDHRGTT